MSTRNRVWDGEATISLFEWHTYGLRGWITVSRISIDIGVCIEWTQDNYHLDRIGSYLLKYRGNGVLDPLAQILRFIFVQSHAGQTRLADFDTEWNRYQQKLQFHPNFT